MIKRVICLIIALMLHCFSRSRKRLYFGQEAELKKIALTTELICLICPRFFLTLILKKGEGGQRTSAGSKSNLRLYAKCEIQIIALV